MGGGDDKCMHVAPAPWRRQLEPFAFPWTSNPQKRAACVTSYHLLWSFPCPAGRALASSRKRERYYPMSEYGPRAPYRTRRCPCGLDVQSHAYARHRRSDACPKRPSPLPKPCEPHGLRWPCASCDVLRMTRAGLSVADVALLMGVSVEYVERELAYERIRARGDALDRAMYECVAAFVGALRKARTRAKKT